MPDTSNVNLEPRRTFGYRVFRGVVTGLWRAMFRPSVIGAEHIPATGPVILAPIHRSNLDFAFAVFVTKRKTFFMAKDSLWTVPGLRTLIATMGAFPVKRGAADREAMAMAERVLKMGEPLVMFPEGTRQEGAAVGELRDGTMFVAARTGATVVPIGIGHTERAMPKGAKFPRPVKVRIVVGEPVAAPSGDGRVSRTQVAAATQELRDALQRVYDQSMADR